MGLIRFVKKWTLPCSMVMGAFVYFLFTEIKPLEPIGMATAPYITDLLPVLLFLMFYITSLKMRIVELRPRAWHFWLQVIIVILSAIVVGVILLVDDYKTKLILEGVFICFICPTAIAAPVITEKLGGSSASLTVFILIVNCVASITIPIFFPLVEKETDITFLVAFLTIFKRLITVLILPLFLAQLTRRYLPKLTERLNRHKNIAFYIWAFNLSIVMGMTVHNITCATIGGVTMLLLIVLPLGVTIFLFSVGKAVGHHAGESINAGQALGQKNTILGIWLTMNFLNPTAAIAPCAYVVWQNIVNSWQLWYKEKYGELKW
ncbi:MAG: bile acid:sodium symporter [Prevotella sp.]|nr:bile acid:sodium symporter [Prevotella sp.]